MKRLMSAFVLLVAVGIAGTSPSFARISQAPDFIENRLAKADFACICVVTQFDQLKPPVVQGQLVTTDAIYEATIRVIQTLKGEAQAHEISGIFNSVDGDPGPLLSINVKYVLFLKRQPHGKYQFSGEGEQSVILIPEDIFIKDDSGGLSSFETSLADGLRRHLNDSEGIDLMDIFLQFRNMSAPTIAELDAIGRASPSRLSLLALEALCRSAGDSRRYVPQLIAMLDDIETKTPSDIGNLGGYEISYLIETVDNDTTVADLERLKQLSNFRILGFNAMVAIRRFHDPKTIPFLVAKLDSDDRDIQYEAVITLAEITGKEGDFAPGGGLFDQDPSKYKVLWKNWYKSQGKP